MRRILVEAVLGGFSCQIQDFPRGSGSFSRVSTNTTGLGMRALRMMLCPSRITLSRVVLGEAKQQFLSLIGKASSAGSPSRSFWCAASTG